jgi:hypothetical protein
MKVTVITILASSLLLSIASCSQNQKKDEEATTTTTAALPDSTVSLAVMGNAPALGLVATEIEVAGKDGSPLGVLSLSEAKIVLKQIELKMSETDTALGLEAEDEEEEDVEDQEDSSSFEGPYLVDLLTSEMTPKPEAIEVPNGLYKGLKLKMHKVEDKDLVSLGINEGDPLDQNSIYVTGVFTPTTGTAQNFTMTYDLSEEFFISGAKGTSIEENLINDLVIAFRFSEWFQFNNPKTNDKDVDLSDAGAGDIVIDKDSDEMIKHIRDVIKENIKKSADFGKDEDGDGELAEDEDSEEDAEDDKEEAEEGDSQE